MITVNGKEISLESLPVYHCHLSPAVVCVDGIFYYLFKNYLLLRDETAEPYLAAAVTYCRNPELRKTGEDDTPLPGWKLKGSYDYIPPYYSGKVDIPEKITYQGYEFTVDMVSLHAFDQSYGLKEVNLPSTVREIDLFAFTDCCRLEKLTLPGTLEYIDFKTFYNCGIEEIQLPDTVYDIRPQGCTKYGAYCVPHIKFSETPYVPDEGFAPLISFNAHHQLGNKGVIELPGTRFSTVFGFGYEWVGNEYQTVIYLNPTDRFASSKLGIGYGLDLKYVVSASETPPKIVVDNVDCLLRSGWTYTERTRDSFEKDFYEGRIVPGLHYEKDPNRFPTLIVPRGSEQAYAEADVWKDEFVKIIGVDDIESYKSIEKFDALAEIITATDACIGVYAHTGGDIKVTSPAGSRINIYDLHGLLLHSCVSESDITTIAGMTQGIYIVKVADRTFKVAI